MPGVGLPGMPGGPSKGMGRHKSSRKTRRSKRY